LAKDVGQWSIARYIMRIAYCSRVKLKTFCRRLFASYFPKSRYGSQNFANFAIVEFFVQSLTHHFSAMKTTQED